MADYTKPVMRIINESERGEISVSPTIMFHIQGNNVTYLTVDIYLDDKELCIDSFTFETYAWDYITFKQYTYTADNYEIWDKIYDGDHKFIFVVTDSNDQTDEATVSFTRVGNEYYDGAPTIIPVFPTYGDNEVVQMGMLCCTRKSTSNSIITKTISIAQFTSYGFCTPNDFFDGVFDTQYVQDYLGDYDNLIVKRGKRDEDGWLIKPVSTYNERIFFTESNDELNTWSWVKTTLSDDKIVFIATTAAPTDFLHPTTRINIKMDGLTYVLRCLSQEEWMSIDDFTLEKIDFGNYMMNSWHSFRVVTSTKHTEMDESVLVTEEDKQYYYEYLTGKEEDNYVCMSYTNRQKSDATGWRHGWGDARPIRPDDAESKVSAYWIPVLELINDIPTIEFPDRYKESPIIYL